MKLPLYECTCGTVENTALGDYWVQKLEARDTGSEFSPKCSECLTGKWHGRFEKCTLADHEKRFGDGTVAYPMPKKAGA